MSNLPNGNLFLLLGSSHHSLHFVKPKKKKKTRRKLNQQQNKLSLVIDKKSIFMEPKPSDCE